MLEFKEVKKRFGGLMALDGLSMRIDRQEIVGLIGPNGAGKTTAVNAISGVYSIDSGTIEFEGRRLDVLPSYARWNLGIARTFQTVNLCRSLSVRENILLGGMGKGLGSGELPAEVIEFAEYTGLREHLDTEVCRVNLFHQKVTELLRGVVSNPKLIMVDELVAGLTDREQDLVHEVLVQLNERGAAILVIEHVMRFVMKICQRVIVMDRGRKIAEGDPASIATNTRVIEVYLGEEYTGDK